MSTYTNRNKSQSTVFGLSRADNTIETGWFWLRTFARPTAQKTRPLHALNRKRTSKSSRGPHHPPSDSFYRSAPPARRDLLPLYHFSEGNDARPALALHLQPVGIRLVHPLLQAPALVSGKETTEQFFYTPSTFEPSQSTILLVNSLSSTFRLSREQLLLD